MGMTKLLFYKHDFDKFTPEFLNEIPYSEFTVMFGTETKNYRGDNWFINRAGKWMVDDYKHQYTSEELAKKLNAEFEHMYKNNRMPAILTHIPNEVKMKGYKTAVYGKKEHRDNITQLENSVRRMF